MSRLLRNSAFILAGFIALSVVTLFIVTRDEAPPDIADLAPRPLAVHPEENALILLRKLAAEFDALTQDAAYITTLATLDDETAWTTNDALHFIRETDFAWARFDALPRASQSDAAFSAEINRPFHGAGLNKLWMAALARLKLTARTKGADEAISLALNARSKALIVTDAGGTMIDMIIGMGLYSTAHDALVALLTSTTPSSISLRQAIVRLEEDRPSIAGCAESFKTTFHRMPTEIENMRRRHDSDGWMDLPSGAQWLYKPNQTSRVSAEHIRGFIQAIDQPHSKIGAFIPKTKSPFLSLECPRPTTPSGKDTSRTSRYTSRSSKPGSSFRLRHRSPKPGLPWSFSREPTAACPIR